jgi:hypothetical protein
MVALAVALAAAPPARAQSVGITATQGEYTNDATLNSF